MRRYETRSTMMTSNRPLEDWGKLIGDVPSATAILDRFLHHAEIITITGKSYRLRNQARTEPLVAAVGEVETSKPAIPPAGSPSGGKRKKPTWNRPTLALRNDCDVLVAHRMERAGEQVLTVVVGQFLLIRQVAVARELKLFGKRRSPPIRLR